MNAGNHAAEYSGATLLESVGFDTYNVFPSDTALLKALYLSTFEATKKWTMPIRNWGQIYGELSIMYEGQLPK